MKFATGPKYCIGFAIVLSGLAYGVTNDPLLAEYFSRETRIILSTLPSFPKLLAIIWISSGLIALNFSKNTKAQEIGALFVASLIAIGLGGSLKLLAVLFWNDIDDFQLWDFMTRGWLSGRPKGAPWYVDIGVLAWWLSLIIALILAPFIALATLFGSSGIADGDPNHRRGRRILSYSEATKLAELERAKEVGPNLMWGWLELPWSFATKHFLACGSTGSGKTTLIRILMQSVLPRIGEVKDERALIYDAKQDILSVLDGMNIIARPVLLNPFDSRSSAWDIAKDVTEASTAQQIASILIPEEKKSAQPFFADAARHLMAGVMRRFIKTAPGNWTLADVIYAMLDEDRLKSILGDDPELKYLLTYLREQKTGTSVLATILTKIQPFEFIAAAWSRCHQKVSLRDWVKGDYILILGNDEAQRTALDALNQAIFKRVVELVLAEGNSDTRRTWFFLDEVREAGKLEGLQSLLTKGRSKGASVVLGFQDIDGLKEVYGEYLVSEITGQCACKALLRTDSSKTAEWASALFGDRELLEVSTSSSTSTGVSKGDLRNSKSEGTSSTSSNQIVKRSTVLPGEIMSLPLPGGPGKGSLEGYYIAPNIGPYKVSATWKEVEEKLIPPSSIPNIVPRDTDHERLRPWEEKDLDRLGLHSESLRKQIEISKIGSNSKQPSNVKIGDESLLEAARQIRVGKKPSVE